MTAKPASFDKVRDIALALPGVEEGTSYGTPAFKVKGKLFARLHQDGETLVLRCEAEEREVLLAARPELFFLTDHYRDHPWVLARFGRASEGELVAMLEDAHARAAPRPRRAR